MSLGREWVPLEGVGVPLGSPLPVLREHVHLELSSFT